MNLEELHKIFLSSSGISTDTRTLRNEEIFFALKGENFDGNKYVEDALNKGCLLAVCEDGDWSGRSKVMVCNSSLEVLQNLANFHRKQLKITVLAITGSNGKTTTKELIAEVLSKKYKILFTDGNLNNHIGVPLTLLRLKDEEIAVIEMGANHPGEIKKLCRIAEPDLGLITNIGKAHLEGFGSLEGVKNAKGELYEYLSRTEGLVLVNAGDQVLMQMVSERASERLYYGDTENTLVSAKVVNSDPLLRVSLEMLGSRYSFKSNLTGSYNITNIMAAAACGRYFDVNPEKIVEGLAAYKASNNRSQLVKGKSNTLILDAYNANPTSLQASLEDFVSDRNEPKMVILGEMLELGPDSEKEHKHIVEWLSRSEIEKVYLVGEGFKGLTDSDSRKFNYFSDIDSCIAHLKVHKPGDMRILLKGSRKNRIEEATNLLLNC